ncbi:MAG: hypothetical protein E7461_03155 [Ruminococcaceae bacterium]|nr:hypothetical protein [Oscillospiraceae bacterium]
MKKLISILLAIGMVLSLAACALLPQGDPTQPTEPADTANKTPPADADVVLTIDKEDGNEVVFGVGTELDPHFFSQNVGLSGISNGTQWTCKEEDWALFEERMEAMNLKRIRVMLLPSWFIINETNTEAGIYDWDTDCMKSLYRVLDSAMKFDMKVNITMWGVDNGTPGFMRQKDNSVWVTPPSVEYEELFVSCFADCIKYLREEKDYTCIREVTLFNEPNAIYFGNKANEEYCNLCTKMHGAFQEKGIRDDVLFNLSDDARDPVWMAKTLMNLDGIIDVANSHTYSLGDTYNQETQESMRDMSNQEICYDLPSYNLNEWKQWADEYPGVPHIWGEFGTCNGAGSHQTFDKYTPERGLEIARIGLNMFNMGSQGMSYWVLFSQYYGRSDFNTGNIMDMGLWGFADEGYNCRPVYYSYSMFTRFIEESDVIFPIKSSDDNIVAVAFRQGDKWSYCVVNNGDDAKKVSFVNMDSYPGALSRYVYDEADVPTDNQVIGDSGTVEADGRVITDTVAPRSFVIYTNK